jgi:hypothetical protein
MVMCPRCHASIPGFGVLMQIECPVCGQRMSVQSGLTRSLRRADKYAERYGEYQQRQQISRGERRRGHGDRASPR